MNAQVSASNGLAPYAAMESGRTDKRAIARELAGSPPAERQGGALIT
jgi:hypothetical protein